MWAFGGVPPTLIVNTGLPLAPEASWLKDTPWQSKMGEGGSDSFQPTLA